MHIINNINFGKIIVKFNEFRFSSDVSQTNVEILSSRRVFKYIFDRKVIKLAQCLSISSSINERINQIEELEKNV